uniref:Uncharacterized protein n=1 Tax=Lactuca sativa TaxID=4236 RepID=A0A9R1VR05_LACSA|nr:hypothetical protein LSAT_V11C400206630 [Lactuca sativa]
MVTYPLMEALHVIGILVPHNVAYPTIWLIYTTTCPRLIWLTGVTNGREDWIQMVTTQALQKKIPSLLALSSRGIKVDTTYCGACIIGVECVDHILGILICFLEYKYIFII